FSSRRRHTRLQGDWSSDVCSSDLGLFVGLHYADGVFQTVKSRDLRDDRTVAVNAEIVTNFCHIALFNRPVLLRERINRRIEKIRSEERRVGKECRYRW